MRLLNLPFDPGIERPEYFVSTSKKKQRGNCYHFFLDVTTTLMTWFIESFQEKASGFCRFIDSVAWPQFLPLLLASGRNEKKRFGRAQCWKEWAPGSLFGRIFFITIPWFRRSRFCAGRNGSHFHIGSECRGWYSWCFSVNVIELFATSWLKIRFWSSLFLGFYLNFYIIFE